MRFKSFYIPLIFLLAGITSILIEAYTDLVTIFRILSVIILVYIIILKFQLREDSHNQFKNIIILAFILFGISVFIMLLVTTTGGFLSPLFVLLHITTIALAFMASFPVAITFLLSSVAAVAVHHYIIYSTQNAPPLDVPSFIIQALSIAGIIPFSAVVAKRYHLQSKIADDLLNELKFKKGEEALILENVNEAIIIMDPELKIVQANMNAEQLTGYKTSEILEKDFFQVFKFVDREKRSIDKTQFPTQHLLTKQSSFRESDSLMQKADGNYFKVDFKLSSVLGLGGVTEGFLFVFNERSDDLALGQDRQILEVDLEHFGKLLLDVNKDVDSSASGIQDRGGTSDGLSKDSKRMIHAYRNLLTLYKLETGEIPGLLSSFDIGDVVREVFSDIADLAKQYEVECRGGNPYSPPLPIRTNRVIFKEIIEKIMELAVFIAARNGKFIHVQAGSSPQNSFVFIRASCEPEFVWDDAGDLFKPYFGKLSNYKTLLSASGLEGYLAQRLLKDKDIDGRIKAERYYDDAFGNQIQFTIELPFSDNPLN